MVHKIFKPGIIKYFTSAVFCFMLFTFTAKAGGDSYEIYLNNTLVYKQVRFSIEVNKMQLSEANYNDALIIHYNHCGAVGTGRSIVLKDDKNNTIREWKFVDGKASMSIPVKEILDMQKKNKNIALNLYYFSSKYLPKGRMLTSINLLQNRNSVSLD